MYLITAATAFEMEAFLQACSRAEPFAQLITGIGPVEAALQLTAYLATNSRSFKGVINLGVGGAYCREQESAELLDICLAEREVLGDLGICYHDAVEPLRGESLAVLDSFPLDSGLLTQAAILLNRGKIRYKRGTFVTVSCVSGSRQRGHMLARQHQALCENMEGAAIARVCHHFSLPLLELRCISNLVEDRNLQNWQIKKACTRCGEVAAFLVQGLWHA